MAKKHLGQNFLKSQKAITTMVGLADISPDDVVLEIGPGKGAITQPLLETKARVIAFEMDTDLIPFLTEHFSLYDNFFLYHKDILQFDPSHVREHSDIYKVVANIPYYITGAIIRHFLESSFPPISMTLLVQKEVAERIVARDGKHSILSLSVWAYGTPSLVMKVSKQYFNPAPKVDSAIIHIAHISKDFFKEITEEDFFFVVKNAFQFKRKNIANNLKQNFSNSNEVLDLLDIKPTARAEDLPLLVFKQFTKLLKRI